MTKSNLINYYLILFPILSGSVLLTWRPLGMSLFTIITIFLIVVYALLFIHNSHFKIHKDFIIFFFLIIFCFNSSDNELASLTWLLFLLGSIIISYELATSRTNNFFSILVNTLQIMFWVTLIICIIQLVLQERFISSELDKKLHPDIFKTTIGYRLSGFSSNPNSLGYFLSFVIWTTYYYRKQIFRKNLSFYFTIFTQFSLTLMTFSRGAILSIILAFMLTKTFSFKHKLIFFTIIGMMSTLYFISVEDGVIGRTFNDYRIGAAIRFFNFFLENPSEFILGRGFSDILIQEIGFTDNFYLELLHGGGVPSLILLLLLFKIPKSLKNNQKKEYLLGTKVIILTSMLLTSAPNLLYFFIPTSLFFFFQKYSS